MPGRVEKKPGRRERSGHSAGEHPELVVNAAILTALHGNGGAVSEIELDGLRGIHRMCPFLVHAPEHAARVRKTGRPTAVESAGGGRACADHPTRLGTVIEGAPREGVPR